jgi:hypothetical protein
VRASSAGRVNITSGLEGLRHQPLPHRPRVLRLRVLDEQVAEHLPGTFDRVVGALAGGLGKQFGLLGREVVVDAGAVLDHEGGVEHQALEPVRYLLGDPADHWTAEAVTHQNDVAQIPLLDEIRHRPDVVIVHDARPAHAGPVSRVGGRIDGVTELAKAPRGRLPRPSAVP